MRIRDRIDDGNNRLLAALAKAPFIPERLIDGAVQNHNARSGDLLPISDTQKRILECMSRGMTRAMTADTLGMNLETVKEHLKRARYRLGAKTTTHACCEAIRRGLIP